jgi:hypothetical protein
MPNVVDHRDRADVPVSKQAHQLLVRGRQPGVDDLTGHDVADLGATTTSSLATWKHLPPCTLPPMTAAGSLLLVLRQFSVA